MGRHTCPTNPIGMPDGEGKFPTRQHWHRGEWDRVGRETDGHGEGREFGSVWKRRAQQQYCMPPTISTRISYF